MNLKLAYETGILKNISHVLSKKKKAFLAIGEVINIKLNVLSALD